MSNPHPPLPPKPLPRPVTSSGDPAADEEARVHEVYEAIAPHFARTRFKPWPLIEAFLARLPPHSVGLDAGAGNGKYLPAAAAAGHWAIAVDRSRGLLDIAKGQLEDGAECVRGDISDAPWRAGVFDFAISIAALHHLSTPERRAESVKALLAPLRLSAAPEPPARFFIYVWAYEQGPNSRRKMGSLAGGEEKTQDFLVPWVLAPLRAKGEHPTVDNQQVFERYYHLFVAGELRALVERAAVDAGFVLRAEGEEGLEGKNLRVVAEGWEADNWWLEAEVFKA
ncbi:tRNA methyltransferase, has a role in tRNA modification [Vanrija albida]|uniref:tRNA methyltransferase, has a role in tRNA modification n=1 Tax=Vanrija albida TaxID=181172 RepID=A0ABR3QE71_9TREE